MAFVKHFVCEMKTRSDYPLLFTDITDVLKDTIYFYLG